MSQVDYEEIDYGYTIKYSCGHTKSDVTYDEKEAGKIVKDAGLCVYCADKAKKASFERKIIIRKKSQS